MGSEKSKLVFTKNLGNPVRFFLFIASILEVKYVCHAHDYG
jgi:hypothetical protein